MRIIDTVVLMAFLDEEDSLFERATTYIAEISSMDDVFLPSATLLELDLELKAHSVSDNDRAGIHSRFGRLIPQTRVLPLTPGVLSRAAELSRMATWRGAYFDTIIVATGLEYGADSAITTDRRFSKLGLPITF